MSETKKTGIFAGVAAAIALVTWWTAPNIRDTTMDDLNAMVGKDLFDKYDPLSAASLKIVKYNEELGQVKDFEVVRDKASGAWNIPSNSGYPADATQQMSEAANTFINLKVLGIASTRRDEQSLFGVIEPNPEKLQVGDKGVGLLVRMADDKNNNLVDLIIGKSEKDKPNHRFVRKSNEDVIYSVAINTDALSTDFTRWIESDLLKLSSNDIEIVGVRDYAILPTERGQVLKKNFEADLAYNLSDAKWVPKSITVFEGQQANPRQLKDDEQLNATKLNEIKNALDSLKIADVVRKPKGLAADLKAEKSLLDDQDSLVSLARRGFLLGQTSDGGSEIFASSGELVVTLKDGIQYLLRFGNTAGQSSDQEKKEADGDKSGDDVGLGLDRYMLVSARLDESKYPTPVLKPLPESFDDLLKMEADANPPAAPGGTEDNSAGKEVPPEPETPVEAKSDQGQSHQSLKHPSTRLVAYQPPAAETPSAADIPSGQVPSTPATGANAQEAKPAQPEALTDEEKIERVEAARERITKENQRLIDDRNEKMEAAKNKAGELNARFTEWYYIIAESEYKRLRVKLEDLIQTKTASTTPASPPGLPNFGAPGLP